MPQKQRVEGLWAQLRAAGDLIVAAAAGIPGRLAAGADNTVLKVVAGALAWAAVATADIANGAVTPAKTSGFPKARAHDANGQSINSAAATAVNLITTDWDTHGAITSSSPFIFTCPVAGKYHVSAAVGINPGVATNNIIIEVLKNAAAWARGGRDNTPDASARVVVVATDVQLAVNDTIKITVFHTAGSAQPLETGVMCHVSIHMLPGD